MINETWHIRVKNKATHVDPIIIRTKQRSNNDKG